MALFKKKPDKETEAVADIVQVLSKRTLDVIRRLETVTDRLEVAVKLVEDQSESESDDRDR